MEDSTLMLVKATLITIVMLGHVHGAPLLELLSMVPRPQRIYIFLNFTIPKMKISTIKYHLFIFHLIIRSVLIDKGSPSNMSDFF